MKLPDAFGLLDTEEELREAIVRDIMDLAYNRSLSSFADEVKNRYGLPASPTEQLVAERVGLRGPHVG